MAEQITGLKKAFEGAQSLTQMEAFSQKQRYDQKALMVTLNKGDVMLIRNNQFIGKRKLRDCWGDEVYTVLSQVNVDVPVYIIETSKVEDRPFTKIIFF